MYDNEAMAILIASHGKMTSRTASEMLHLGVQPDVDAQAAESRAFEGSSKLAYHLRLDLYAGIGTMMPCFKLFFSRWIRRSEAFDGDSGGPVMRPALLVEVHKRHLSKFRFPAHQLERRRLS